MQINNMHNTGFTGIKVKNEKAVTLYVGNSYKDIKKLDKICNDCVELDKQAETKMQKNIREQGLEGIVKPQYVEWTLIDGVIDSYGHCERATIEETIGEGGNQRKRTFRAPTLSKLQESYSDALERAEDATKELCRNTQETSSAYANKCKQAISDLLDKYGK